MRKYYYLSFVMLCLVMFSSCTDEYDVDTNQVTAEEEEGRKGKVAAEASDSTTDEEDTTGEITTDVSDPDFSASTDDDEGRKGKVADPEN